MSVPHTEGRISAVKTAADMRTVAALAREIWTEHYTPIIGAAQVEYMLDYLQSMAAIRGQCADGCRYYLWQVDDEPAGYCAGDPEIPRRTLWVSKLYVRKDCRGRGGGRHMVDFLAERAREWSLQRLRLGVNRNNRGAIAAYRKMGFNVYGKRVKKIGRGFVMDDYMLEKKV
ncbi:GNAT family N-acetyltransferase [Kiritimatiella glycovorans]|uniref:GCN5-related N-acetyltransferase n=1 Tax=Kiritimatiella glycovorans TaxID=1307763 RepID=A0A0G3EAQ8_9BACT|nr:GNAT family N-acetyltransferase [Kiritimatiella glycovorans]AKJ63338.1 GCN5-related N-acetyltransferase [Kiritimatiella glycovorans]